MFKLRCIGDVHGLWGRYCDIVKKADEADIKTLQVGDFGFRNHYLCLKTVNPDNHRILLGNHDDYIAYHDYPHFLGDFGTHLPYANGNYLYYVRGENSIDKHRRTEGLDWWPQEELSYKQGLEIIRHYSIIKPKIMVTHGCPASLCDEFSTLPSFEGRKLYPSMTAQLLQCLWEIHKPFVWVFGHYHNNKRLIRNGTEFICINECCTHDIEV